jgi:hypothetical protein
MALIVLGVRLALTDRSRRVELVVLVEAGVVTYILSAGGVRPRSRGKYGGCAGSACSSAT